MKKVFCKECLVAMDAINEHNQGDFIIREYECRKCKATATIADKPQEKETNMGKKFEDFELQALEIAVKAGLMPPQGSWVEAMPDVARFFIDLGRKLETIYGGAPQQ